VTLSLREILELEPLRRARPQVLAGRDRLDEDVRWVHVTELPDIAYLLRGSELLLTTGMAIAGDSHVQEKYIAELAKAGVAGVVVELGRNFSRLPDAMVEAAKSAGLPLVALERETRFVEVTEAVHREIINRQYELLRRAEQVSRELTELILSGAELGHIVGRLAEIFDDHVVLEDDAHQVVEIAGVNEGLGDVLAGWDEHARRGHTEVERGTVHSHNGAPRCMWVTLWLRHQPWGRLHVLETRTRLDDITELLVDRAGAALSLTLLSEKDAAHLADRARSALVGEVVSGRYGTAVDFLRRAHSLGADLGGGRLVVLAAETTWPTPPGAAAGRAAGQEAAGEEARRLAVRAALAADLRQAATERACGALVGLMGDHILAVLAVPGVRSLSRVLEDIVDEAASQAKRRGEPVELTAGTSRETMADSLPKAVDEAVAALSVGRRSVSGRSVHHFTDLGTYQLLVRLAQGPELARFVDSELRAVLDHDARGRTTLLPTLTAYLEHAGRKADTIRDLGIQRRTLYARLERLEALLGRSLESQDTRTRLALALQGLALLQDRRPLQEAKGRL
jgi:PucR family transcriptional regulator, purine catabolism regulatory protein